MWVLVVVATLLIGYFVLIRPHRYWMNLGVKQTKPMPILGDQWKAMLRIDSFAGMIQDVYKMHPSSRYSGAYQFLQPQLVIRDPDLIKQVTVKDFDHFVNHGGVMHEDSDPFVAKNLFFLKDQRWRDMRSTLSPVFTSSKMKTMFSLILESTQDFSRYFLNQNKDVFEIEMKDTFTRFTNDIIASIAFGIKCDSLEERENEFYVMGKRTADFSSAWKTFKMLLFSMLPWIYKTLDMHLLTAEEETFFHSVVKNNIRHRELHGLIRQDMIHLLMQARKRNLVNGEAQDTVGESDMERSFRRVRITNKDITAQAMVFFFAGFDAVSALMCFMSHELGINQDVQERLRREVDETLQACNGKLTYESLLAMKYMDMVVSETLRKWPNTIGVDRICTKPYTIQPKTREETPVKLRKGDGILLPIFGLHRDPKHFPDPERFDPERFSEENRPNIKPYTYMPFGFGPRSCIGSRFALLTTKAIFVDLLGRFEIVPGNKTVMPLKISKESFTLNAEGGFWFDLKRRPTSVLADFEVQM